MGDTGSINVANLALPYSALCGSTAGFVCSGVVTVLVSLMSQFELFLSNLLIDSPSCI